MAKKKTDSQGEIIDEIRKARADIWREYRGNMKKFHADSRKMAEKLGIHYVTPPKRRKKNEGEDAA